MKVSDKVESVEGASVEGTFEDSNIDKQENESQFNSVKESSQENKKDDGETGVGKDIPL